MLGPSRMLPRCSIQVEATALRMTFSRFQHSFATNPHLHQELLWFVQYQSLITSQIAACNSLHAVEQRFARWILMLFDRVSDRELPITQECISQMLGVRRSSVSATARRLQERGLIRYRRGKVAIVDRKGLECVACECYSITARLLKDLTR